MSYADEQWPHHGARMVRIREAGLYDEYIDVYSRIYNERIPDPFEVGNMAEAVISDDCKIEASGEVCYKHGLGQYAEEEEEE